MDCNVSYEVEQYNCDSQQMLMQDFGKIEMLEEVNQNVAQMVTLKELASKDEKSRLMKLFGDCENDPKEKTQKVLGLQENLSKAVCDADFLSKSNEEITKESSKREEEIQKFADKLTEAECSRFHSIGKGEMDEIDLLSDALQGNSKALDNAHISLVVNEETISKFSAQISSLQDVHQNSVMLEQEHSEKTRELQLPVESENRLEKDVCVVEEHEKEISIIACTRQASLDSHGSKIEEMKEDMQGLQYELRTNEDSKHNPDIEASELKKELMMAHEIQLTNHIELTKEEELYAMSWPQVNIAAELEKTLENKKEMEKGLEEFTGKSESLNEATEKERLPGSELKSEIEKRMDSLHDENRVLKKNMQVRDSQSRKEMEVLLDAVTTKDVELHDFKKLIIETTNDSLLQDKEEKVRWEDVKSKCETLSMDFIRKSQQESELLELHEKTLSESINKKNSWIIVLQEKGSILNQKEEKIDLLQLELSLRDEQNEKLTSQTDSLKEEVNIYQMKISGLEQSMVNLNTSLPGKVLEVLRITKTKESIGAELRATTEELCLGPNIDGWGDYVFASDKTIPQTLELMHKKEEEFKDLVMCSESNECALYELNSTMTNVVEENGMLKQSVIALQERIGVLLEKINSEKSNAVKLCSIIEEKDMLIESKLEEMRNLQLILEASMLSYDMIAKYEEKVKELETNVVKATTCLQEKEERLFASEWAVEQLANEVSKAKTSLAQKERTEMQLQKNLSDVGALLKAKGKQLMQMDGYMQNLLKKKATNQSEIERLIQALQRMQEKEIQWNNEREKLVAENERIGNLVEAKIAELSVTEEQNKERLKKEKMMEGAMHSLKSEIANYVHLLEEERSKYECLLCELETLRVNENMTSKNLRDAERNLQVADELFKVEAQKLQCSLSEAREEIASSSFKQVELESDLVDAIQEVSAQKEKWAALSQMVAAKDGALKDLQCKFDHLQEQFTQQRLVLDSKDMELTSASSELKCYAEKEKTLIANMLYMKNQIEKAEKHAEIMQEQNAMLISKFDTMANEIFLKTEEIQKLTETQKNMQMVFQERGNRMNKLQEDLDYSSRSIHDTEAEITHLRQLLRSAEMDLISAREEIERKDDAISMALAKSKIMEENCKCLEEKIYTMHADIETAMVASRNQLQGEIQEKQKLFEISNADWKHTVSELKAELESYYRNEIFIEAQVAALMRIVKEMHLMWTKDEELWASKSMLCLEDMDSFRFCGVKAGDKNMDNVKIVTDDSKSAQLVLFEDSRKLNGSSMILELQATLKGLQLEQQKRKDTEYIVRQKIKDALLVLSAKETQTHELVATQWDSEVIAIAGDLQRILQEKDINEKYELTAAIKILQRNLQEKNGKDAHGSLSKFLLLLQDSLNQFDPFQCHTAPFTGFCAKVDISNEEKESCSLPLSEFHRASLLAKNMNQLINSALEQVVDERNQLQLELHDMSVKARSNTEKNEKNTLRSRIEASAELHKKLEAVEVENLQLQKLCQRLDTGIGSVQTEIGQLEEWKSGTSEAKRHKSLLENQIVVDSRQELSINDGSETEQTLSSMLGRDDTSLALGENKASSDNREQCEVDLDRYVDLCDTLVRRHATLEKQLDNLTSSFIGQDGGLRTSMDQGITARRHH